MLDSQRDLTAARRPLRAIVGDLVPRSVLAPWLVSRALVAVTLMIFGARAGRFIPDYQRLVTWDGNWYRIIATSGYGPPPHPGSWSTWPFFPLLPGLVWLARQIGSPYTVALVACSNVAALIAFAGVRKAALLVTDERAATWAVWLTALFPGSITFVMGYPDSLYLAGAVWAFVLVAKRRPGWAGVAALVATAARPNGFVVLVALAVAVAVVPAEGRYVLRSMIATLGPSIAFLVGWGWWLWHATGDPFVFVRAKGAWVETTLAQLVTSPIERRWAGLHLLVSVLLAAPFVLRWRRYPVSWRVLAVLSLVPPLALGLVGLARYGICCFPLAIAAGDLAAHRRPAARLPRWPLIASAALLVVWGLLITQWSYVP